MKRRLSCIEHMIDGNIVYFIRLEGMIQPERVREALNRLQKKHPALRMLIRRQKDGLYYEQDCAPEIPLQIRRRTSDEDYRDEASSELRTPFPFDQAQLRVIWLQSSSEQEFLFTTSHRICDGMSMLTVVREFLRALHTDEEPAPYAPVTTKDIIGGYTPDQPWKGRVATTLLNTLISLLPSSRHVGNEEFHLEWSGTAEFSTALKARCKAEGVSIHAAILVALERALYATLGDKKTPAWIESPMDIRRGRFSVLKSDMIFFGGGSLKLHTEKTEEQEFWSRARLVNNKLRKDIEEELLNIPGRYYFYEMLRPVANAKIHTMVKIGDALRLNGSWNRFALSNLGPVNVVEQDAPFKLKDLRLYVHSFNVRLLGLVCYFLNDEMRFYYVGDLKCMSQVQAETLREEIMSQLELHSVNTQPASPPRERESVPSSMRFG